jgi:nickel/cobalt exporter
VRRVALLLAVAAALMAPAAASAHPLGNFTVNRYSGIELSGDRVYVHYVVDLAEIPTFQLGERVRRPGFGAGVARGLELWLDGRRAPLRLLDSSVAARPGAGGLDTLRFEAVYEAAGRGTELAYRDTNFADRRGWREVVVAAERGARVEASTAPARSISRALTAYPSDLLREPPATNSARVRFQPGALAGTAPSLGDVAVGERAADGFERLVSSELSLGVILFSLLAAMFWGAAHALTPGHGKAIVAAYMVGTRGTARHAFLLGGVVTVTHTVGVFALGLVTLALSEFIVPEQLYPWLNLVSALLVVGVGITVLRYRLLTRSRPHHHRDHYHHHHHHDHHHHHHHHHGHDHHQGPAGHTHVAPPGSGLRGLVAVGISGGLLPCPTALVVLLAAISLHRVAYGLVLILAFSAGLAAVITGIGLLAVGARRTFRRLSFEGPIVRALPAVSALVIVGLGLAMTIRALPTLT